MMKNILSAIDFSSNSTMWYIILGIAVILIIVIVAVSSKSKKKETEVSTKNDNIVKDTETIIKDNVKQSSFEKAEVKENEKQATIDKKAVEQATIKDEKIEKTIDKPVAKEIITKEKQSIVKTEAKAEKTEKKATVEPAKTAPAKTESKNKSETKAKNKVEEKAEKKAEPKAKTEPKEKKEQPEKPIQSEDDGVYHKPIIEDFIMESEEENDDKPKVTGKFRVEKVTGFYQFSLYANNGQLLYESREYATEATCKKGVETFKKNIAQSDYRVAADKNGGYKYIYRKGNSIYIGESYSTAKAAENSAKSVRRFAAVSEIVD